MSIKAAIYHLTHYKYDRPVTLGPQIIRLRPAPHSRTGVISHSLRVSPGGHFVNHQQDPYGNWLARFVFPEPVRELKIEVDLVADMTVYNPFDFFVEESAEEWPFDYPEDIREDLSIYMKPEPVGPHLKAFLDKIPRDRARTVDFVVGLNAMVSQEVGYVIRMEPGVQTPEETFSRGTGSCRDSSWLLVQTLRNLGLAARFVSGYLIQLKPDLIAIDGPAGTDHDFTDLHAWCEVYLPGAGWIGLDPTSGLLTGESHVPLAATPHYRNAAPISGVASYAEVDFDFDMKIYRVAEHPRITKPYSEEAWAALNTVGEKVDRALAEGDVRLTMGGEPTFVSIDDFESGEWNTDAVGPTKRALADTLIRKLRDKFAPGGFLHYGQGKWYPGETLPRWTFSLYWRRDEKPIWSNPDLIAVEGKDTGVGPNEAEQLLMGMADALGVEPEMVTPAFEDPATWILKEANLPENVTPENSKLEDAEERHRISRVFSRGLTEPTGFVLPIQRWQARASDTRRWRSERWKLRRKYLFLVPGDSPVGYRIPLSALPYVPPSSYPYTHEADPTIPRGDLPEYDIAPPVPRAQAAASFTASEPTQDRIEQVIGELDGSVRTALSVEAREGRLCVFMPPTERIEDYLELIAAAEAAAKALNLPVHIEGYAPPHDPRLNVVRVAPDPGVIEVNIHPATSWKDCVFITETVYEEARQSRLGADKFMIDGRHTGTGGGNHVVVGGSTTLDSPFLRRPDVLRSLILHWQRHPSMSYLFSGLFIGPTSQAPRVDEARLDGLYELEIAMAQMPGARDGGPAPALARRPAAAQPARRCDRQYAPRRDLHRQALLARWSDRPARPRGIPRLRDAARSPDVARPAAPDPRDHRALLGQSDQRRFHPLGHGSARPVHAAAFRLGGFPRRAPRPLRERVRDAPRLVRGAAGVPLPVLRRSRIRGRPSRIARGARTLACAGRDRRDRRHGALYRLLDRAVAGEAHHSEPRALRRRLQRPPPAPETDGDERRLGRGRALQGLAAGASAPSRRAGACAAHLRHLRHLEQSRARRLRLSRRPSGRTQLRHLPGERQRGGGAASRAVRIEEPHARPLSAADRDAEPGLPAHARPAQIAGSVTPCAQGTRCRRTTR
jgi:transglutaminase-like putative cysteine protease